MDKGSKDGHIWKIHGGGYVLGLGLPFKLGKVSEGFFGNRIRIRSTDA